MSTKQIAVVTGGAGFIGSHMVDLLVDEGFHVRVIDNLTTGRESNLAHHRDGNRVTLEKKDITGLEPDDSIFHEARYVFHFAGLGDIVPSIDRPIDYMATNVLGTVRVLEAARKSGVEKLVYAASSSCYGICNEAPTNEDAPISPQYPYALSKYQGEQAVLHWHRVYHLPVAAIRIFNAYGVRSRTTGAYGAVFGVFLAQKLSGKPFTIVGDGTQTRDFVYATDVARAFFLAAERAVPGRIFNLGAGDPQSVNRLVELLGAKSVTHLPKRPGEPDCTWADISRIRAELGWEQKVSFEEGVGRMLEAIELWKDAPVWDEASIASATEGWFAALGEVPCRA